MISIRSVSETDADVLSHLWTAAGLDHHHDEVAGELASVLARDRDLVLIAEVDGEIVGSVFGAYDGRRGWLNRLATRPDARGRGIAGSLVRALETALRAKGCHKINLLVEPANAQVVSFYRQHDYSIDEKIFMEKRLL